MKKVKLLLTMLMLMAFSVGNVWATDYELVTSTSDLEAGAHYVIGCPYNSGYSFIAVKSYS